ncbi:alpha-galactosidase [Acidicapsa acidisoli]|uniref:alpha-galactosidase n=1 Tax=Acidicapsa acidisoli TaxID=1615681 RepID=UPI0021E0E963|nr:alpha-galactosidase [Acidicapsa acidisoli]
MNPRNLKTFPKTHLSISVALPLVAFLAFCTQAFAQPESSSPSQPVFRLDGGDTTYAFGVNERGELQQLYWGGRISAQDAVPPAHPEKELASFDSSYNNTPQEYAGWGAGLFQEPALKVTFADGNRDLVLHYVSSTKPDVNSLEITLKDISRAITVTLHYKIDPESGILARSATIENSEPKPVMIEQAAAASFSLPPAHYTLNYLTGRWAGEWTLNRETIQAGERVLESRRGTTGHQANPWFAIGKGDADEEHGETWFGALAWSGSWRIVVEQDQIDKVRITGGFNPFDFGYQLKTGEKLETPVFYAGYSHHGFGGASRLLNHFTVSHILPEGPNPKPRPVIYNSWEATEFAVTEAGQEALAEKAAALGIDRFVMDDGWFGQRKTDHAGLGDWYVNKEKFPNGLKPLIDKVHSLGMDFGLWVEPEMVNPNSDLYRQHPDWVLNFPGRPRTEQRNQLVLNLARQDVRDYVYGFLDKLLSENQIAFLKWDYNRNWSEPGWDQLPPEEQKKVYVQFTRNLYSILAELRAKHPGVEIESCSGGGGRVDLGILHYTDEVWPSDNTDPLDRLTQQDGFTRAYPVQVMMAWVTDSPHWLNGRTTSVTYRMLVSMQGSLGIGGNLNKWSDADLTTTKRLIAAYHQVQKTITQGDLYRLISPTNGSEFSATETVSPDKSQAVFFAFAHSTQEERGFPRLQLLGLDPTAEYSLTSIEGKAIPGTPAQASGSWWMNHGVDLDLHGDFQAAAFRLDRK